MVGYFAVSSGGVKLVKLWYCIYALVQHRVVLYCEEVYCKVQSAKGIIRLRMFPIVLYELWANDVHTYILWFSGSVGF